jgi:hypothetical protein
MISAKRFIVFLLLSSLSLVAWSMPYYSEQLQGYLLPTVVYQGDTIPYIRLREFPVFPAPKFKDKKTEKFYWRTVRDVKKVYPYVKFVGEEYRRIDAMCDTISDQKEKKRFLKKYEKELLAKYKPIMKTFTLSQGKMMIKLIDRECEKNSYDLIKQFRGGFVAWWWQVFAKMLGADLKDDYDIAEKEQDKIIERVIILYEAGAL